MKRFIFAVVLFAVVLGGSGLFEWMLLDFESEVERYCAGIEQHAKKGEWTAMDARVKDFEKFWKKKEGAMTYIVDHARLNIITSALDELRMATDTRDAMEVLLANARMRSEAGGIVRDARFRTENIF